MTAGAWTTPRSPRSTRHPSRTARWTPVLALSVPNKAPNKPAGRDSFGSIESRFLSQGVVSRRERQSKSNALIFSSLSEFRQTPEYGFMRELIFARRRWQRRGGTYGAAIHQFHSSLASVALFALGQVAPSPKRPPSLSCALGPARPLGSIIAAPRWHSGKNIDLAYVVRAGQLIHERNWGDATDSNAVTSAIIRPDGAIDLIIYFGSLNRTVSKGARENRLYEAAGCTPHAHSVEPQL